MSDFIHILHKRNTICEHIKKIKTLQLRISEMRSKKQLTERGHVHDHEVAAFWNHRGHADGAQDTGQAVPLPLQLISQRGEVAVGLAHALVVYHQALCYCLLQERTRAARVSGHARLNVTANF